MDQLPLFAAPEDVCANASQPFPQWCDRFVFWINRSCYKSNSTWLISRQVAKVEIINRVVIKGGNAKNIPHHPILHLGDRFGRVTSMEYNPNRIKIIPKLEVLSIIDEIMSGPYAGDDDPGRYGRIRDHIAAADHPVVWR